VIWNRSLIQTESNRLGLVAKGVRKGDKVCILYGCSVPVILRRCEKPKTAEQIAEEERYDIQELFLSALEAGKQLRQKLQERKRKYEKCDDKDKEVIKTRTNEVNGTLMLEKDKRLKKIMNDWLELQKRKEAIERLKMHQKGRGASMIKRDRKIEDKAHEIIVDQWVTEHKSCLGNENQLMNHDPPKDHDSPGKKRKRQRKGDDNAAILSQDIDNIEKKGAKRQKRKEKKAKKAKKLQTANEQRSKSHSHDTLEGDHDNLENNELPKESASSKGNNDSSLDDDAPISRDTQKSSEIDGLIKQLQSTMGASDTEELTETIRSMVTRIIQEERGTESTELNEDKKWHYKFLGECYIHGMMDGEAIREFTEQGLNDQVFELR